jgi:hypothetical protein
MTIVMNQDTGINDPELRDKSLRVSNSQMTFSLVAWVIKRKRAADVCHVVFFLIRGTSDSTYF